MTTREGVIAAIEALRATGSPAVVAISGYGGSGKSTLTRAIVAAIPESTRLRGDDFIHPDRFDQRSPDWGDLDRVRLRGELDAFRATAASGTVLVVDSVGIIRPELSDAFDLTVWVDVPLELAATRGKARDRVAGNGHDRLWDEVWTPNERDFDARFGPRATADLLYDPAGY